MKSIDMMPCRLFLLSLIMSISASLSPHDDLVKSIIQAAEYETIQEAVTVMFIKIDHLMAACVSEPSSLSSVTKRAPNRVLGFCGLFSSELIKVTDKTIFILSAPEGYSIKTVFLLFDTSWSGIGCPKHGMKWEDGDSKTKHYCGKRHPWLEYSDSYIVRLRIYGLQVYLDSFGFDFYIFYSICRICVAKKTRVTTVIVYNIINFKPVKAVSHTNSIWHIFCKPGFEVRLVVYYGVEEYLNVLEVYAGPGPKSTKILPSKLPKYSYDPFWFFKNNISRYENRFDTDTSHAYIVNTGIDRNVSLVFRYVILATNQKKNCHQKFPYDNPQVTSAPFNISVIADGKKTVQCYFNYETNIHAALGERVYISLEIIDFVFQGPTIVSEYSDQPCHYGGVFFYSFIDHHLPPYILCNAKGEYIPRIIALPSNIVSSVFQWFKGYSYGRLSAILHVTHCIINHIIPQNIFFVWPASSACQQFIFSWQSFLETVGSSYSLNITSASDVLLGPSILSYSLVSKHLSLTEANSLQIIAQHFTTWPKTDHMNELVFKHKNMNYRSKSLYVSFLFKLTITLHITEVTSDWQIKMKVARSVCTGIMKGLLSSESIMITEGCTMDHVVARNKTVTFIHAPLNNHLTYITLEREKECKGIYVTKDEVIPSRDIHRQVYMRFTNIEERVVFKHEISQSILTVTFNLTSLAPENCVRVIRVTPNDLSIKQQTNAEEHVPQNIEKQRWIFHNKR